MQPIDRKKFFDGFRSVFGSLDQDQVDGIERLLGFLEADEKIVDLRHVAYLLGTVKWECGNTWQPVREYGLGRNHKYGIPDSDTHQTYYGRGYTQITWKENYRTFGMALGLDLLHEPDLALEPKIAYRIMSYGMRTGAFTGVGLPRYFNAERSDWVNARKIINGLDQAENISRAAQKLHEILKEAA